MKYSLSALRIIYDDVIEVSEEASIIVDKNKYGIIDLRTGEIVKDAEYERYEIYENHIIVLNHIQQQRTFIYNSKSRKWIYDNKYYKLGSDIKGVLIFHELRAMSRRKRSLIVRKDNLDIILADVIINLVIPDVPSGYKFGVRLFNSGYNIPNITYYIKDNFDIELN